MVADLTLLRKLAKTWRNRRERLRKETKALGKNAKKSKANEYHSNIEYGKFLEVEKCAGELIRTLNRMVKGGMVHEGTVQHNKEQKPEYYNRCLLYCPSYKAYHHDGAKIIPSYCLRLKRSIYEEQYDQTHPKDCPVNRMRVMAGLKEICP